MFSGELARRLAKVQAKGVHVRAQGLRSSSRAYYLARLLEKIGKPLLVLTSSIPEGRAFAAELEFFLADTERGIPGEPRVLFFPPWDTLTFENIPPHPEISAQRITALHRTQSGGPFVVVAPVEATLQKIPSPKILNEAVMKIAVGQEVGRDSFIARLLSNGYQRVEQVEERGEVSVRGGIMDIFAPHYTSPLRLEFFGDEVESIRSFDSSTQRSTERLDEALLLPAREVIADEAAAKAAFSTLRRRCHKAGMNRSESAEALELFRDNPYAPQRESLLPYYVEETATLWEYLPGGTVIALDEPLDVRERAEQLDAEVLEGSERALRSGRVTTEPAESYITSAQWSALLENHPVMELAALELEETEGVRSYVTRDNTDLVASLRRHRGEDRLLTPLASEIQKAREEGHWVCIIARTAGMAEKLRDFLREYEIEAGGMEHFVAPTPALSSKVTICLGALARGFRFPEEKLTLITQAEIFGMKGRRPPPKDGLTRSSLGELQEGDLVVHADFGIGRYMGMTRFEVEDNEGDFLHLEYAGGDKLFLPVTRLALIRKYLSPTDPESVKLDKIGGKRWERARAKAREGVERMAHELLDIYARRALAKRDPYSLPDLAYREFAATFPYEETRDQGGAIDDVLKDLASAKPMDRLICGDVGYGKTEVAIRAAFQAVHDGRQVAILTPTTVLAAQHFQSFKKRFEGYPVEVNMLSRFVSKTEQELVTKKLSEGKTDIVVGTHALLKGTLRFKNLGLVVLDEEHRFGVSQKEKLKKLRADVDTLTLTATPIPRTLQMSFTGIRDLSVIETPPADRLSVRTRVARFDDEVVKEALKRELGRGGQVYFVHNRVQSIDEVTERLKGLMPGTSFAVAHGQMKEQKLQEVMEKFSSGEVEVLVCTAIIESGLDIPRANTIIINRADMFGLADLYQLRGRVGRSNVRAYCYLLLPPEEQGMTADAHKRLQAIQQFTDLGAGFKVAMHDLEIRGAGDLLGKNQSGHIAAIGFDLYAELLEEAVARLKGAEVRHPPEPEIRLKVPAHFPEDYVPDPRQRLALYERFARITSLDEADDMRYELIDRFGPLPEPVINLIEVMKIRFRMVALRATTLDLVGENLLLAFSEDPAVEPDKVMSLITGHPGRCRLTPDQRIRWGIGGEGPVDALGGARELLSQLE